MGIAIPVEPRIAYLAALVLPVAALLLRMTLQAGEQPLLILFVAPIALSAFLGGWLPGLLATLLSAVLAKYYVLLPVHTLLRYSSQSVDLMLFLLGTGIVISMLLEILRRQQNRLQGALQLARRRAVEQQASEERFAVVFHSAPVAIMIVRLSDGHVVDVNSAYTELWGYTRAETIGQPSTHLCLWVEPAQLIPKLRANRHCDSHELQIRAKSGAVRDVLLSVALNNIGGSAHMLVAAADITERNHTHHMEHVAHHDTLTDLPNRLLLQARLREAAQRATTTGSGSAILFVDLDRFKSVNDNLGHRAGDELLRLVASRLQGHIRSEDTAARVGGDEFVIVLQGIRDVLEAETIAGGLVVRLSDPFVLSGGREVRIGASIGVTYLSGAADNVELLIQQADAALYAAKISGRGTVRVFDPATCEIAAG